MRSLIYIYQERKKVKIAITIFQIINLRNPPHYLQFQNHYSQNPFGMVFVMEKHLLQPDKNHANPRTFGSTGQGIGNNLQ